VISPPVKLKSEVRQSVTLCIYIEVWSPRAVILHGNSTNSSFSCKYCSDTVGIQSGYGFCERFLRIELPFSRRRSAVGARRPTPGHARARPPHTCEGSARGRVCAEIDNKRTRIGASRRTTPTNKKRPPTKMGPPIGGRQADDRRTTSSRNCVLCVFCVCRGLSSAPEMRGNENLEKIASSCFSCMGADASQLTPHAGEGTRAPKYNTTDPPSPPV
jgi:hypothetical protein